MQRERRNLALQLALSGNPANFAIGLRGVSKTFTRNATVLAAKHDTLLKEYASRGKLQEVRRMMETPEFKLQPSSPMRYVLIVRNACTSAFIAACESGQVDVVRYLLLAANEEVPRVDPTSGDNKAIRVACEKGNVELFTMLMNWIGPGGRRVDPTAENNECICIASEHGYTEIVAGLLADKRVDATANNQTPLRQAVSENHVQIVQLLLKWKGTFTEQKENTGEDVLVRKAVDPTIMDNLMIQVASLNDRKEIVRMLLSWQDPLVEEGRHARFVDATAHQNISISYSSSQGFLDVVNALLDWEGPNGLRVDPAVNDNYAIRSANMYGHKEVVERLRADPRVDATVI